MNEYKPYWVLKNKVKRYTRIHKAEAGHCRNGEGPRPGHTGCWQGFESYEEARIWADGIGWPVLPCSHHLCQPVEQILDIKKTKSSVNNWSKWYQFNQPSLDKYVPNAPGIYEIRTDYKFGRLKGSSRTVNIGMAVNLKQRLGSRLIDPRRNWTLEEQRLMQKGHGFEFRYANAVTREVIRKMENDALFEYFTEHWELPPGNRVFPKEVQRKLIKLWNL